MSIGPRRKSATQRAQTLALRVALGLPEPIQRFLGGRAIVRDGQTLATDTQLMLRLQRVSREPGPETLPIQQGRLSMLHHAEMAGGVQSIGTVRDLPVGDLPGRLYVPASAETPGPILVFLHGGGWIFGDLDSHDASCRFVAERSGIRVLAIDYRLGPEDRFPAAYDDALAAYRWVLANAESLDADPARLAIGGDSAGGNLAAVVALAAATEGLPLAFQLLIYPAVDATRAGGSYEMFSEGFYLTRAFMDLADTSYLAEGMDIKDPRLSPLFAEVPPGLAPAYVVTAGFDPLRDEGEAYARKLAEAGVEVELKRFPDQIHGFFNIVGVGRSSRAACAEIAAKLKAAMA